MLFCTVIQWFWTKSCLTSQNKYRIFVDFFSPGSFHRSETVSRHSNRMMNSYYVTFDFFRFSFSKSRFLMILCWSHTLIAICISLGGSWKHENRVIDFQKITRILILKFKIEKNRMSHNKNSSYDYCAGRSSPTDENFEVKKNRQKSYIFEKCANVPHNPLNPTRKCMDLAPGSGKS